MPPYKFHGRANTLLIDLRHPLAVLAVLAVLASRMPWQEIEASVAQLFARRVRSGKAMVDVDPITAPGTFQFGRVVH